MRNKIIGVLVAVTVAITTAGFSASDNNSAVALGSEYESAEIRVIDSHFDRPPDVMRKHTKFTPEGQPSANEAQKIAKLEQKRWGGPWLGNRIACESNWNWAADNGTYNGILQFGPIWYSMWPGTPLDIKLKSHKYDRKKVWLVERLSNGTKTRTFDHYKRVKVVKIKEGNLPANADAFHAWAAIRVGQRAVSGDGPTTGWSCGL